MNHLKQRWQFSEIVILFALFILAGASCRTVPNYSETEEEDRIDEAPVFKPAYIAPAKLAWFLGNVQALKPHWIYVRQLNESFSIQGMSCTLANVRTVPKPIPTDIALMISDEVMTGSKEAENVLRNQRTLAGIMSAYVVFDENRKDQVILYRYWCGIIVAAAADHCLSTYFQSYGNWHTCTVSSNLTQYLDTLTPKQFPMSAVETWLYDTNAYSVSRSAK